MPVFELSDNNQKIRCTYWILKSLLRDKLSFELSRMYGGAAGKAGGGGGHVTVVST